RSAGAARCRRPGDRMMDNGRAGMATGNVRILRMFRLLGFMTLACAAIGGAPSSFGETPKFEGVYKGSIVLRSASATGQATLGASCNPSTKQFEQIMRITEDRVYLERKAVQLNIVFTGTIRAQTHNQ